MPWGIFDAPRPYRDELHFGYFGRLQTYWLTPTANDLARHLRGGTKGHASGDLLGLSDDLVRYLAAAGIDAEHLLWRHTLLPYYLAFQTQDERTRVVSVIGTGSLTGLHFRMGIGSSRVKHPRYFRYCPACWRHELAELGEVYVKRLFQLPGVLLCPVHDEPLCDTTVHYRPLASRAYWNFTGADGTSKSGFAPASVREMELARLLALDARRLLLQGASVHPRAECLAADYHRALQHLGLASRNMHPVALESAFLEVFPMSFLLKLGLAFEPGWEGNWLRCFVRKSSHHFHPLQHLLFRRFVESQLSNDCWAWMEAERWPCLSPLRPHPGPVVVSVLRLHVDASCEAWDGIFVCACGCRYSGGGDGYPAVERMQFHRVIAHSPHLQRRVVDMAAAGCNPSEIAQQLKLHRKTVRVWLNSSRRPNSRKAEAAVVADREAWLVLVRNNSQSTLKELKVLAPALFSRVYAHDAAWLKSVPLPRQPYRPQVNHDEWQRRDPVLARQVADQAEDIRRRVPAVRVTMSRIGRELGLLNLFRKSLRHLPGVADVLAHRVESVEDFQIRRLKNALQLLRTGKSRVGLLRAAGLRPGKTRPGVFRVLESCLFESEVA